MSETRQHAHELIDQMAETQLSALVGLLKRMVDPSFEDEKISAEEEMAVAASEEWFKHNKGTSFEEIAAELGFTMEQVRNYKEPA